MSNGWAAACAALALSMAMHSPAWAASPKPPIDLSAIPAPPLPDLSLGGGELVSHLVVVEDDLLDRSLRSTGEPPLSGARTLTRGGWQFELAEDGRPIRGWADRDNSDKRGYRAERIGYCKDTRERCEQWFEAGRHRPPRPQERAGKLAYAQWRNRVLEAPCVPGVDRRPSMAPLHMMWNRTRLKDGFLVLALTLDACGEVRDAVVHVSSGKPDLDRAAIAWAKRAQFVTDFEFIAGRFSPSRGSVGLLPFMFGD